MGARAACIVFTLADVLDYASDPSLAGAVTIVADTVSCGAKIKPRPKKTGPSGCSIGGLFFSFEAGTEVETQFGRKRIEDIKIGDLVASRDAFSGDNTLRPVTELFRRTAPGITHLTVDSPSGRRETLGVTSEHPLFAEGKGWTAVRLLLVGDHIQAEQGKPLVVAAIDVVDKPVLVYNLEVGQDHSYYVGEDGAWAHNAQPFTGPQQIVIDWAKGYKSRRISPGDADALVELAHECGLPARGPERHLGRPYGKDPHIHVGPIDHIFLK